MRSSPHVKSPGGVSLLERMTLAEDMGYNDTYFPTIDEEVPNNDNPAEYILSRSPPSPMAPVNDILTALDIPAGQEEVREQSIEEAQDHLERRDGFDDALELRLDEEVGVKSAVERGPIGTHESPTHPGFMEHVPSTKLSPQELPSGPPTDAHGHYVIKSPPRARPPLPGRIRRKSAINLTGKVAEAVFFSYGVSVFFGFQPDEEKDIMEDIDSAGIWAKGQDETDWEVEEFHYVVRA